jgi:hypothetical protein
MSKRIDVEAPETGVTPLEVISATLVARAAIDDEYRGEPIRSVYLIGTWSGASGVSRVSPVELSLAGCYVETSVAARVGEAVTVTISAGLSHPLVLRGNVLSIDGERGFAVQYVPLPAGTLARLNALIEYPEDVYRSPASGRA